MEERITSRRNPLLAHTKKLLTSRSYREKMGEFAADGVKLLAEAARWYPGLTTVIAEDGIELCKLPEQTRVVRVPKDVMQSISLMDAPQGAIFLCRLPEAAPAALVPGTLLLDGIQDPGNLGTILRVADWFGIHTVLASDDTVDVFSPKVLQATMGALARVKVVYCPLSATLSVLANTMPVYGTFLDGDNIYQAQLSAAGVIVMGNEGNGISPEVAAAVTRRLRIPSFPEGAPAVESLNVGTAAAVTVAEFRRRTAAEM